MLLQSAMGDAYGAGFEFAPRSLINAKNDLTAYHPHLLYPEICGRYTDDTQMALALAELIISGVEWSPLVVANKFVSVFK
ncbi:ADP-ribosylglycohydrolase family protein [Fibrella sp. HMF5036]|uniref:ADP-ribosylglycohydrolase family protein n=1 Tax=Fibrella aquatilis TaxID=2817059 RepID=A0A939GBV6_9BACT|nr:ADP-ribosylglycohydrolase family protein [Fibrella aquatilis]